VAVYPASVGSVDAASLIRSDRIDVLVDLSGHTAGSRLGVFALRAAPVQVTWMGYFATTGLAAMDYILRDPEQIPAGEEWQYTEKLWPLHSGAFSFDLSSVPVGCSPGGEGPIRFGNFNNLAKISEESLRAWAQVLKAVPDSILLLARKAYRCQSVQDRIGRSFSSFGVDPGRLRFLSTFGGVAYFELYDQVDIVLDTFPFNGGTTTYEALARGVPVVAHRWDRMAGHFAESILSKCGCSDWVASDLDEFVSIAAGLAGSRERLAVLRRELRGRLAESGLCSSKACASELEDAFFAMVAA